MVPRPASLLIALGALILGALSVLAADTQKAAETRKKLQNKVTVDYQDTTLNEVVEDLKSQVQGLGIRLDTTGGVSRNMKITYKAKAKPLAEVLDGMFQKNGLGYVVASKDGDAYDGTIMIKQGKERGFPAGQEPAATAEKTPAKDKEKSGDKAAAKEKAASKEKATAKEKPEEDADKTEHLAASKLKLAKQLADDGKVDKARQRYKDIIEQYPKTKAAEEARAFLKKLDK